MNEHGFLALSPQYTSTGELLARAARRRGLEVAVLSVGGGAGAVPKGREGHYYGGPAFAAGVVEELSVALLEPEDDWLAALPSEFTRRRVSATTLGEARRVMRPVFVKPPSDKSFPAAVYSDGGRLPSAPGLPADTPVLISEVVTWEAEFRLFVLDGEVRAASQYAAFGRLDTSPVEGHRHREAVSAFAARLLAACGDTLPSAVVVDVGLLSAARPSAPEGWAVVEANMAWFSNAYAADPDRVLDVVLRAAGPRARASARDRRFQRAVRGG
ncbi:ATP-grasp domain-containing protein [Streptomyces sp. SP18CS02]|uniref:ATP-grasp domain-containing protein n=1 Tax=Streptomyces sp. SP18CS02 TaxID=3002531 RepID=UPI002E783D1A|nr:ATP-grasp domain-containing protein [Streptomyces sp. SP18CS02]MEE1753202.1 ATP-grasp domain-containing protein [Streptomyces sp. SP18CS02]